MPPLIIVLHLESFKQWTLKGVQLVSDLFCLCACKNLEIWDSVSWGVFVFSFQIWQQAFRQWGWDVHIRRGEFCGVELHSAGSWWFAEVRGVAGKIKSATAETWNPQDKLNITGWLIKVTQEAAHVESCIFTLLCPQYAVYRIYAWLLFPTQGVVNHLKENQQTAALSPIHCCKDIFCNIPVKKWSRFMCPSAETKNIKQQHSSHSSCVSYGALVGSWEPTQILVSTLVSCDDALIAVLYSTLLWLESEWVVPKPDLPNQPSPHYK